MRQRSGGLWAGGGASGGIIMPAGASPDRVCSYTAESGPSTNSSLDVWGAYIDGPGSYVAAPVPPIPTQSVTGTGASLYGTANDGEGFGINTGVLGATTIEAFWAFDLSSLAIGVPTVCKADLKLTVGGQLQLAWSDDGASWTNIGDLTAGPLDVSPFLRHPWWAIHFGPYSHGGGYYAGIDLEGLCLWGAF